MARKGIEEMISEIEIFIDNCKYQPLSSSKIIVPKEDLEQMVGELKLKLPNEDHEKQGGYPCRCQSQS